jgi:tight adherence protein C
MELFWPLIALGLALLMLFHAVAPLIGARYAHAGANRQQPDSAVAPPPLWRITRVPVRVIAYLIAPFCPTSIQNRMGQQLKAAGMDQSLSSHEFLAGRMLLGMLLFVICLVLGLNHVLPMSSAFIGLILGVWLPGLRLNDHIARRRASVLRDLPVYLDLITLGVQGGMTTASAIGLAVDRGPPGALRGELVRALREVRTGRSRQVALRSIAERLDVSALTHAVGAIIAAERQGADLSNVLKSQSEQRRHERFLEAERQAMRAPVKMLFPLVVFIFPGTFLILLFPIVLQIMESGLF